MGKLIEITLERIKKMNEATEYKDMRQTLQSALNVNRDRLFDSKDPIKDIEKIYKEFNRSAYLKVFTHIPKWYGDILNWYILLDMHGYQEDEISISKGKKKTFKNTTHDSFHAAFASTCDFYITNDKKSYKKAKEIYKKLEINTKIFTTQEFVTYHQEYLTFPDPIHHLETFFNVIQGEYYEELADEKFVLKNFYFHFFLFDYFTRAHINFDKLTGKSNIFLSRAKPTNGKWVFQIEIIKLIEILNSIFGDDIDKHGLYDANMEDFTDNWRGRRWDFNSVIFRLGCINGWVQLYMDIKAEWPDA